MDELISKQAALNGLYRLSLGETDAVRLYYRISDYLKKLPPAPERTGHWIDIDAETYTWKVRCDKCGNERSMMSTQGRYPKFCEECGAHMIEEE